MKVGGWMKEDFSSRFTTEGCGERKFTIKIWGFDHPWRFSKAKQDGVCCHEVARFSQVVSNQLQYYPEDPCMVYMLTLGVYGGILMVNVTIYSIHGSYGLYVTNCITSY